MFNDKSVLIVEDNAFLALDLSVAIEELDGGVVGPTALIAEALDLLDSVDIAAAIVDCHIPGQDCSPLTDKLTQRRVPFVIHAAGDLNEFIGALGPDVPVLRKPLRPRTVLACLLLEMSKSAGYPVFESRPV